MLSDVKKRFRDSKIVGNEFRHQQYGLIDHMKIAEAEIEETTASVKMLMSRSVVLREKVLTLRM